MKPVAVTAGLLLIVLGLVAVVGGAGTAAGPWLGVVCLAALGITAAVTALRPESVD